MGSAGPGGAAVHADSLVCTCTWQAKRVEQDKIEAALAEAKRKEVLDRAERLLHDRQDRVKTFHSAMLLSEVIKVSIVAACGKGH